MVVGVRLGLVEGLDAEVSVLPEAAAIEVASEDEGGVVMHHTEVI